MASRGYTGDEPQVVHVSVQGSPSSFNVIAVKENRRYKLVTCPGVSPAPRPVLRDVIFKLNEWLFNLF